MEAFDPLPGTGMDRVEFYIDDDDEPKNIDYSPPWEWLCDERRWTPTFMKITAISYDLSENKTPYEIVVFKWL